MILLFSFQGSICSRYIECFFLCPELFVRLLFGELLYHITSFLSCQHIFLIFLKFSIFLFFCPFAFSADKLLVYYYFLNLSRTFFRFFKIVFFSVICAAGKFFFSCDSFISILPFLYFVNNFFHLFCFSFFLCCRVFSTTFIEYHRCIQLSMNFLHFFLRSPLRYFNCFFFPLYIDQIDFLIFFSLFSLFMHISLIYLL